MTGWRVVPIRELCTHVVDCVNKTAPTIDSPSPFKMIHTTNVREGWVDIRNVKYTDEATFDRWTRRLRPLPGDVVLTREAPLGEVGMLRSDEYIFLGQRLVMYRADPTVCDGRFLLYAMLGPAVQAELRRLGSGSTVEHLRVPDCEVLPVLCPPLAKQRRIADVLWAFDELIENNRRRIEILEETARSLYREWFVRYRFPGHESVEFVDSSLGHIPCGWSPRPFGDLCRSVTTSADPRKVDPDLPAIGLEHLPRRSTTLSEWASAGGLGSRKLCFEPGDVLFGKIRPYFHKVALASIAGVCSTDAIVLRPNDHSLSGLVLAIASSDEFVAHAIGTSNGTKMPRADWKVLAQYSLAIPDELLVQQFSGSVAHAAWAASALAIQNRNLSSARDLLLPKLVTGKIDVDSLGVDDVFGWAELAEDVTAS